MGAAFFFFFFFFLHLLAGTPRAPCEWVEENQLKAWVLLTVRCSEAESAAAPTTLHATLSIWDAQIGSLKMQTLGS